MVRNRIIALIALGTSIATFSSCEKEIEYTGEAGESLLVINQLIDKDSSFSIEIERSVFFLENNTTDTHISDATVTLTDLTNGSFETLSSGTNGIYDFSMSAIEGHQYDVTAVKVDFPTASATTLIPSTIPIISVDTSTYVDPEYQETTMRATLNWNDPAGKNYYLLTVSSDYLGGFGEDRISMSSTDASIANGGDIDGISYGSMMAIDDSFFDGTNKSLLIEFPAPSPSAVDGIDIRLYHCTEDAYRYLLSAETELINGGGGAFSEPVKVHTNIVDGYGIFAGYSQGVYHIQY